MPEIEEPRDESAAVLLIRPAMQTAPFLRLLEGARPKAAARPAGVGLRALIVPLGHGPALFHHRPVEIGIAGPAEGEHSAVAIRTACRACDAPAGDEFVQRRARLTATRILACTALAGLGKLR